MSSLQLDIVRSLFNAIETGDADRLDTLFHPEAIQIEIPNSLKPKGDRRSIADMKNDMARGATILASQTYEIIAHAETDATLAVRVLWKGVLAITLKSLTPGDVMTVHSAMFFTFRDGKIIEQTNYDCFGPF
jgi:ketosteroid isomerase-like protein